MYVDREKAGNAKDGIEENLDANMSPDWAELKLPEEANHPMAKGTDGFKTWVVKPSELEEKQGTSEELNRC